MTEKEIKGYQLIKYATIEEIAEALCEYRAIGTVEKYREAVEKQKPKKPIKGRNGSLACKCGLVLQSGNKRNALYFCHNCGQRIDWSEEE